MSEYEQKYILQFSPNFSSFALENTKTLTKDNESTYLILQLDSVNRIDDFQPGKDLYMIGKASDDAVLCTKDKSFLIRKEETSNTRLLVDKDMSSILTSGPQIDKTEKYSSLQIDASVNHHFVLCEKKHDMESLRSLLKQRSMTKADYNPNTTIPITKLYSLNDLKSLLQSSETELLAILESKINAFEYQGYWRVLSYDLILDVFAQILDYIIENDWTIHELKECSFQDFIDAPSVVIRQCLKHHCDPSNSSPEEGIWTLDAIKVAQFRARQILHEAEKANKGPWELNQFLEKWSYRLPEGVETNQHILKGIALIESIGGHQSLVLYPHDELPLNPQKRFNHLFNFRSKWKLSDLEPYLKDIMIEGSQASLLLKYTRSSILPNSHERLYSCR